jgi:hypothetical protein
MSTHVKFKFTIGHYNGTMSMQIFNNDCEILTKPVFTETEFEWDTVITWPTVLTIKLSGKDNNCDTKVENDQIVADKFIQLTELTVDKIPAALDKISLATEQTKINTNYWGFNGVVSLNFDCKNSFVWHLQQKNSPDKSNYVVDWLRTEGTWHLYKNKAKNVQSKI